MANSLSFNDLRPHYARGRRTTQSSLAYKQRWPPRCNVLNFNTLIATITTDGNCSNDAHRTQKELVNKSTRDDLWWNSTYPTFWTKELYDRGPQSTFAAIHNHTAGRRHCNNQRMLNKCTNPPTAALRPVACGCGWPASRAFNLSTRDGRYSKFRPRYLPWKNTAVPGIPRYLFYDSIN